MIYKFPYTDLYSLNLDWMIQAMKEMQSIVEPLDRVVNSVNNMTGDVVITKAFLLNILESMVSKFNGRAGDVTLTAADVNNTMIDITWTSDPGDVIGDIQQNVLDQMYAAGKRVLIFLNNLSVPDTIYFLTLVGDVVTPQIYSPTAALAGVASFNGQTGAVTATGSDLDTANDNDTPISESIENLQSAVGQQSQQIVNVESGIAIIVNGDTATQAVPAGGYAYIKNNTHGLAEGIYKNTSSYTFPVSGGTADNTIFSAVLAGAVNDVITSLETQTGSITPSANVNEMPYKYLKKKGGIANFYINGNANFTAGENMLIATLSEGFRPNFLQAITGVGTNASGTELNYFVVIINTNGEITLKSNITGTRYFNISTSFICE